MTDRPQGAGPPNADHDAVISVSAPAKINLFLHLVGRRPDGYHLIQSLFVFASFGDNLTVTADRELRLELEGPFADDLVGEDNLVLEAATALAKAANLDDPGATIRLCKNLPVAAGIGGGSADAAAGLRALNEHWHLDMPEKRLLDLALGLGADVPACLIGRASLVSGIGDQIVPYRNLPDIPLVLVNPGVEIKTGDVFEAHCRQSLSFTAPLTGSSIGQGVGLWDMLLMTRNDLQSVALKLVPQIGECLEAISAAANCRLARMSGSGASCFGLFKDQQAAVSAAKKIASRHPEWWVKAGHLQGSTDKGRG